LAQVFKGKSFGSHSVLQQKTSSTMAAQDRRTNMVNSSVKGQPAKGGAGGGFTWGSAMDTQEMGYLGGTIQNVGVVTQAAPVMLQGSQVMQVGAPFVMEQQAFPTLGGAAPAVMGTQAWGPGIGLSGTQQIVMPAQRVAEVASVRAGVAFDGAHPRNQFASKPYVRPASTVIQVAGNPAMQGSEGLINWAESGIPVGTMQAIVGQSAHLGPYQALAPRSVPLEQLRVQNMGTSAQFAQYAPKIATPVSSMTMNKGFRSAGLIQQPQKR